MNLTAQTRLGSILKPFLVDRQSSEPLAVGRERQAAVRFGAKVGLLTVNGRARGRRLRGLPHMELGTLLATNACRGVSAIGGYGEGHHAAAEFDAASFLHGFRVPDDHAAASIARHGRATFL